VNFVGWCQPTAAALKARRVVARRGQMRMPLSGELQSIRTRSEESEEGGVPPNAKVDASSKKSVADQDDENRIAPAGFDVNGEETWKWKWHQAPVRAGRQSPGREHHGRMATHGERYQDLWPR